MLLAHDGEVTSHTSDWVDNPERSMECPAISFLRTHTQDRFVWVVRILNAKPSDSDRGGVGPRFSLNAAGV